jgi:MarR family transcriptional regulator for hemolysin
MGHDIEYDLLGLMHDVARLIRVEADKRARLHGLTRAQWGLLLRLERSPGLSQKEIADLLEVEPISVARLVDRLEASDLVERRADAVDRRVWRLHLRPAAAGLIKKIHVQRDQLVRDVTDGVTQQARGAMIEALLQMKANLSRTAPANPVANLLKETG